MNKLRIVGAVTSMDAVTLYLENGEQYVLSTSSLRTAAILDEITGPIARHETVELDLDTFVVERMIEKKSKGFIRFVWQTITGSKPEMETISIPLLKAGVAIPSAVGAMQPASAVKEPEPVVQTPEEPKQLVAIVGHGKDAVRIPGAERLQKQMERAAYGPNFKGFEAFMKRLAAIAKKRKHTADELLHFMERADLPIADDGSIIAYKVLKTTGAPNGRFVDCHSSKVSQAVGSFVYMDESLIDDSRRTQCSTGLHIARRKYLGSFLGDIITMVKINPEDVIAVPYNEPDKMRVAGYHIIFNLPSEVHSVLRSNQPMTGNAIVSKMLADAIAGNHVEILEKVKIGAAKGGNVTIEKVDGAKKMIKEGTNGRAVALDDVQPALVPAEIRAKAVKAIQEAPVKPAPQETPVETKAQRDARKKREKRAESARLKAEAAEIAALKVEKAKSAKPKKTEGPDLSSVPPVYRPAVEAVLGGMSQRKAEIAFPGTNAKKIRTLIRNLQG
jgi:hypothetical protein